MSDVFSPEKRRWIMSRVRNRDTAPEVAVRSMIHRMGYRFRLHARDLPGTPDIVLPRHKKVVFVHGCFWHGHEGCPRAKLPQTNAEFWRKKIETNVRRDRKVVEELAECGWQVLIVWGCELRHPQHLTEKLADFLRS